jgi:hypothetical protein
MEAGTGDPVATAERWHRNDTALRLRCFETWLTDRIHRQIAPTPRTRALFELVDGVRELRSTLDVPINRSLAIELLFRRLAAQRRAS